MSLTVLRTRFTALPLSYRAGILGGLVVLGLLLWGQVDAWLHPQKPRHTVTQTDTLQAQLQSERDSARKWQVVAATQQQQQASLAARLTESERTNAQAHQVQHEVIYRYLPGQGPVGPAPGYLPAAPAADGSGAPSLGPRAPLAPGSGGNGPAGNGPIEIVVRDTRTDTSANTARNTDATATGASSSTVTKNTQAMGTDTTHEAVQETVKAETTKKDESGGSGGGSGSGEPGKLGVGILANLQPFASYDLASAPLGPRLFGLGRLGAGLFVTGRLTGPDPLASVDGGPEVNWSKGSFFVMGGYQVRQRTPTVGVGLHFKF